MLSVIFVADAEDITVHINIVAVKCIGISSPSSCGCLAEKNNALSTPVFHHESLKLDPPVNPLDLVFFLNLCTQGGIISSVMARDLLLPMLYVGARH